MNGISFEFHHLKIEASDQEPQWAPLVERWYQLDRSAYVLAEAYWQLRGRLSFQPELLLLASPGASNQTDFKFVQTKLQSASKFVHTLANVRGSTLFQLMGSFGPMLCLQNGNLTMLSALKEAIEEYQVQPKEIWLFSVNEEAEVYLFRFGEIGASAHHAKKIEKIKISSSLDVKVDSDLRDWLIHSNAQYFKWNDVQLERTP